MKNIQKISENKIEKIVKHIPEKIVKHIPDAIFNSLINITTSSRGNASQVTNLLWKDKFFKISLPNATIYRCLQCNFTWVFSFRLIGDPEFCPSCYSKEWNVSTEESNE